MEPPLKIRRHLEGADLVELRRLTEAGVPNKKIARVLRATYLAVSDAQRALGIYRRQWREPADPPLLEIERRAAEIRREWSPQVEASRRVGGPGEWAPLVVPASLRRYLVG